MESLAAENTSLRSEIGQLTESSEKLRLENSALMVMNFFQCLCILHSGDFMSISLSSDARCTVTYQVKLKDTAEPSPSKAAASPSSPRASAENFLSMIDSANAPSVGRHTEHGGPRLRQLLDSSPATDVATVS